MVGLGRMGGNMAHRLKNAGHEVVGFDLDPKVRDVDSIEALVEKLEAPRVVWVMLPAGHITEDAINTLSGLLAEGDVVVDGGNSRYTDDVRRAPELAKKGIGYVDAGISGGVWGLQNGYGTMVGGSDENVAKCQPLFDALKPEGSSGFVHAGDVGAGHFVKMVHNGIEYGLMQAWAEGYELMMASPIVTDVKATLASWQEGTVVRGWLLDLLVKALDEDEGLKSIRGRADDSGEGRWTIEAAIDHAVPMPAISAALFARFASRQDDSPAMKAVAAMRNQFGGHPVTKA